MNQPLAHIPPTFEGLDPRDPGTWPAWLSLPEVCQILRLALGTVRQLTQERKLKARRFGRQLRVHRDELTNFTANR